MIGRLPKICLPVVVALGTNVIISAATSAQLRIVDYNTATGEQGGKPTLPRDGLDMILESIGNEEIAGVVRPIDVLVLQEQSSAATTTQEIVNQLNAIYGEGMYDRATRDGGTWGAGRPGLVYNTQTIQLERAASFGTLSSDGQVRQTLRYRLQPVGYGDEAEFYVYNNHYKASTGEDNQRRRNVEATSVRDNADALGEGTSIIYAGDFNIRSSSEAMYQTLLAAGPGQAFDPIDRPGNWHNNDSFRSIHTQSPADGTIPGLITGGVDDRFDFQLVSGELLDGEGLDYLPGSYRVFGNNGSHRLNDPINSSSNDAQPDAILNHLARVTDHLPVVADYQIPAIMQVTADFPTRVLTNTSVAAVVQVANSANVSMPLGADELEFLGIVQGAIDGDDFSGQDLALGSISEYELPLQTAIRGSKFARVTVTSDSPGIPEPEIRRDIEYTVVNHARGSLGTGRNTSHQHLDFSVTGLQQQVSEVVIVNNSGPFGETADLDIDNIIVAGDTDAFSTDAAPLTGLMAGESVAFDFTALATELGSYSATWTLGWSDEDLPGALSGEFTIAATVLVALPGDANLDGAVDVKDFNIWNDHKFTVGTEWSTGDFNLDHLTDEADLAIWSEYKFMSAEAIAASLALVPEPSLLAHFSAVAFLLSLLRPTLVLSRNDRHLDFYS